MGVLLDTTDYPNADPVDVGQLKNYGYGSLESVPTQSIVSGATSLLTAAITSGATTIIVSDPDGYPATPFVIQIAAERLNVTNKSGATFTVTRGYDSTAAVAHAANLTVFEVLTEYIYLVNDGPVKSIDNVFIDGFPQLLASYTAYTGQAGDAHTDWPGVAVVTFAAESYIGKQYNLSPADTLRGTLINARVDFASDPDFALDDDETISLAAGVTSLGKIVGVDGPGARTIGFVKFKQDPGTIQTQTYLVDVENVTDPGFDVGAYLIITEGDQIIKREPFTVAAGEQATLEISRAGGIFDDVLRIVSPAGSLVVSQMRKETFIAVTGAESDANIIEVQEVANDNQIIQTTQVRFASYPATALGTEVIKQTHSVECVDASGDDSIKNLRLSAVEKNGTLLRTKTFTVTGSSTFFASITHDGGGWDAYTSVTINDVPVSKIKNLKMKKSIQYSVATTISATAPISSSSARIVVGSVISVDGAFAIDTTGDYGGINSLIERPDNVIKHFLVTLYDDYGLASIDATTFTAAGTFYDTNNYIFAGLVKDEDPEALAFQCRSIIQHVDKWQLIVIPEAAPSEVKTIDAGDIAGGGALFTYESDSINEIENDLTGRYKHDQSDLSNYLKIATDSDSASKTKYGTYQNSYNFSFISDTITVVDVLAHILLQNKSPRLYVTFSVTHDNFDLRAGDTIKLTDTLFNNNKYFIEEIRQGRSAHIKIIKAREWAA